jgi:transcriptional regulator with XRE-family HTH domain
MTEVYRRVYKKKLESGLTWNQIAKRAHIGVSSWMTGLPYTNPTDKELKKIAPVLNTTYEYLKYGKQE